MQYKTIYFPEHGKPIKTVKLSPGLHYIAVVDREKGLTIYDSLGIRLTYADVIEDARRPGKFNLQGGRAGSLANVSAIDVCFRPFDKRRVNELAVVTSDGVSRHDVDLGVCFEELPLKSATTASYSPDGRYLAATDAVGRISVWYVGDRSELVGSTSLTRVVTSLQFKDSRTLYASTVSGEVFKIDAQRINSSKRRTYFWPQSRPDAHGGIVFRDDVIVHAHNCIVTAYDVDDGTFLTIPNGIATGYALTKAGKEELGVRALREWHASEIRDLELSDDGHRVALVSDQGLLVWHIFNEVAEHVDFNDADNTVHSVWLCEEGNTFAIVKSRKIKPVKDGFFADDDEVPMSWLFRKRRRR